MLEFLVIAKDKPNSLVLREAKREEHLQFLNSAKLKIKLAGPLLEKDNMVGTVLVVVAESLKVLQEFLQEDPYQKAGLFASVTIQEMKVVINNE
ncbi:YciI family protein [Candidatus Hepatincola sp. Pdp]